MCLQTLAPAAWDWLQMSVRDRVAIYLEMLSRSRVLQIVCVGWFASVSACSNGARQDPVVEFSTEVDVAAGQQPAVTRTLQAGAYLLEVREQEIDVRTVIDAGGMHVELEDQTPRHGSVFKVVRLGEPAALRIQLRSVDHHTKTGRAVLTVARWKGALPAQPSELELGFQAFGDANEQAALDKPETLARAADRLHEALIRFGAAGDDAASAAAAYELANVQYARDDWMAAVRATETATEAYNSADDRTGIQNAAALRGAAELELASGMNAGTQRAEQKRMYEAADRRLAEAAAFFATHNLPVRAEYAVNMRGIRALNVGDYDSADKLFSQAVEMARANNDVSEQTNALGNLAWVHYRRGFVAQAAREYEKLLPVIDKDLHSYQYAVLLANYGFALIALGDFDRALEVHTEALELYTKVGDQDERATELSALGGLYFRMGDAERALETLRAAIVAQEQVSDARGLASTLRIAGNASAALGLHAQSLDYLRKSAQIDANPQSVARTSVLVAGELRALGKLPAAEAELAVPLASANALVRANALEERARLRSAQRDQRAAIADLRAADQQYVALGLEFNRIDANTELSRLLLAQNDLVAAAAAADEAISIVGRIRAKSANPEWRARFLSARYSPFEARIAVELADNKGDVEGAAWRAFRTAEDVRARSLADELAFDARGGMRTLDANAEALRARLTSQQLRLETRMQRQEADESGTLEVRRSIEETRALIDRDRLAHGGVAAGDHALADSLQQIQKRLPPETAVLAYFVGDYATQAWLLSKRDLQHATLPGREPLQRAVDAAVDELRHPGTGEKAERRLAAMLFGELLEQATEKRILVIPDGPLNGLPFAALPVAAHEQILLVDRFVLSYAPSLALALAPPRQARAHPTRVAVVSDPVYAPDDRRLHLASSGNGGNFRGAAPPSANQLTRLPYSALEAAAVTKAFGSVETIELSGFDATTARVRQLPTNDLAVLHFATHARARRDSPEQSALYLSEYGSDGKLLQDSVLTAGDITRSGLRADVVVLSGCATGDGGELRGEGVLGLTYGFLANGSQSVVAALWPIEDASTARFMSEFYRAYKASGSAAEALRTAQLRVRASASPQVWSSFVVRANQFP
jgi:CHAT domain-containing protein/tetratricopeptide (TPR) repeat protein